MSYYKIISGIRYSRDLLERAEEHTTGRGEGKLSYDEVREIYTMALDGPGITDTERRTLLYIADQFELTNKASDWLQDKLLDEEGAALEATLNRIVREEYELPNMSWDVAADEVRRQESLAADRLFGAALRAAFEGLLHNGLGQLSFAAVVSRHDPFFASHPNQTDMLKAYLDDGVLSLLPMDEVALVEFDLPEPVNPENFWIFQFNSPEFEPLRFFIFVHRNYNLQYNRGSFSRKVDTENLVLAVVKSFNHFAGLETSIDTAEVERQMALMEGQNFGNALFGALHTGIFNGESSISFRDFIRQEIWQDPDLSLAEYMRQYIDTGTLHLIPLDYEQQTSAGTASFPVPDNLSLWQEGQWVFGLEMPEKTSTQFIITVPRDAHDGDSGWNDGFIPTDQSMDEQIQQVVLEEFQIEGLDLIFSLEEAEAQQQQFGPTWHHLPSLVRQALNTILDDYISQTSIFQVVSQVHLEDVPPADFENPQDYRAAIRNIILGYLNSGTLEFLSKELPDNNPIDGEPIEAFWQFFVYLPSLSDHGFWVIIPRYPESGQLPYVYGAN